MPLPAQSAPAAKPRIELADSARGSTALRAETVPKAAMPASTVTAARPRGSTPKPAGGAETTAGFRSDFVRAQALIGVGIYAPAFATTVARDGITWAASYLLVAGGSFVAAAEISREMTITDPMQRLATGGPIRGAVAGSMLASAIGGDAHATAASVLFGAVGGTAAALLAGRQMNDGEAAATLFGSDVLALAAFAGSTASGFTTGGRTRTRAAVTVTGMLLGAPLGHAYAALAPYHVSVGDLTAMSAAAGVGMLAGLTAIVEGDRSDRRVAGALAIGGVAGLIAGDRFLVRRYDHTASEGRLVVAGGLAGGLMGAGVALLTGSTQARLSTVSAALTTAGAAGGIMLSQRYLLPKADGALRLGSVRFNPMGAVAAAAGMRGTHTLASVRF